EAADHGIIARRADEAPETDAARVLQDVLGARVVRDEETAQTSCRASQRREAAEFDVLLRALLPLGHARSRVGGA
ncbi:hypothetical protein M885DRAFT_534251, partial [Pelagophyceae sp. CCMP2097]